MGRIGGEGVGGVNQTYARIYSFHEKWASKGLNYFLVFIKKYKKKLDWISNLVFCMRVFKYFLGFLKLFFQWEIFHHADEKGRDRAKEHWDQNHYD